MSHVLEDAVDIALTCTVVFVSIALAVRAFWRGTDDADWEREWQSLDDLDRAWIAAASLSQPDRQTLEERGELELAKGHHRREQRRQSYLALAILPLFIAATILTLTGVLASSGAPNILIYALFLLVTVCSARRPGAKRTYRRVQAEYLAAAGADPATTP